MSVTPENIREAHGDIKRNLIRTPMVRAYALRNLTGIDVSLKLENMQHTSSFKVRGAYNRMKKLSAIERKNGVVTLSAGNHGQAVAYHAKKLGIPAVIVMPEQTPFSKINRTKAWGAEILLEGRSLSECECTVARIIAERDMTLIHPYNDFDVITGQGSIAIEMLEDVPDLDTIIVPIGGGGLIAGIATIAKDINPNIKIIGVESQLWPSMTEMIADASSTSGGDTLAEGIAVKYPGDLTKPIVEALVDEIVLVDEDHIERAISTLIETQRIVAEGAGATGIAALLQHSQKFNNQKCGVVICGGNIDIRVLTAIMTRSMAKDGRLARLHIHIKDEPGALASVCAAISECNANIVEIFHQRVFHDVPVKNTTIDVIIETKGSEHVEEVIATLNKRGYSVRDIEDKDLTE